jgi:hypothetical protein
LVFEGFVADRLGPAEIEMIVLGVAGEIAVFWPEW